MSPARIFERSGSGGTRSLPIPIRGSSRAGMGGVLLGITYHLEASRRHRRNRSGWGDLAHQFSEPQEVTGYLAVIPREPIPSVTLHLDQFRFTWHLHAALRFRFGPQRFRAAFFAHATICSGVRT